MRFLVDLRSEMKKSGIQFCQAWCMMHLSIFSISLSRNWFTFTDWRYTMSLAIHSITGLRNIIIYDGGVFPEFRIQVK